jgi:hypothetical protein
MAASLSAAFNAAHGYTIVTVTGATAGLSLRRRDLTRGGGDEPLPAETGTVAVGASTHVDYLTPLGTTVRYMLRDAAGATVAYVDVVTPTDRAYLRHLYHPSWGRSVRVVAIGDVTYPARQTLYSISGRRFEGATYDVRAGREFTVGLLVVGVAERAALMQILEEGNPVSFGMCGGQGEESGVFAVGDVHLRRVAAAKWVLELPLTEVGVPHVTGGADQVTESTITYDRGKALNATYDAAAARYASYTHALAGA